MNDLNFEDTVRKNTLAHPLVKSYLEKGWKLASTIEKDKIYLVDKNHNQLRIDPITNQVVMLNPQGYRV